MLQQIKAHEVSQGRFPPVECTTDLLKSRDLVADLAQVFFEPFEREIALAHVIRFQRFIGRMYRRQKRLKPPSRNVKDIADGSR